MPEGGLAGEVSKRVDSSGRTVKLRDNGMVVGCEPPNEGTAAGSNNGPAGGGKAGAKGGSMVWAE